jgi:hypothetical protein
MKRAALLGPVSASSKRWWALAQPASTWHSAWSRAALFCRAPRGSAGTGKINQFLLNHYRTGRVAPLLIVHSDPKKI